MLLGIILLILLCVIYKRTKQRMIMASLKQIQETHKTSRILSKSSFESLKGDSRTPTASNMSSNFNGSTFNIPIITPNATATNTSMPMKEKIKLKPIKINAPQIPVANPPISNLESSIEALFEQTSTPIGYDEQDKHLINRTPNGEREHKMDNDKPQNSSNKNDTLNVSINKLFDMDGDNRGLPVPIYTPSNVSKQPQSKISHNMSYDIMHNIDIKSLPSSPTTIVNGVKFKGDDIPSLPSMVKTTTDMDEFVD